MSILHVLPAKPEDVEQQDLDFIIGLDNQILRLKRMRDAAAAEIFDRLLKGALVEQGTHTAELACEAKGITRTIRLVVR